MQQLKRYVGKHVVVQFADANQYFVCHGNEKGQTNVTVLPAGPHGSPVPTASPVLEGIVTEKDGDFFIEVASLAQSVVEVQINPEHVLTVSRAVKAAQVPVREAMEAIVKGVTRMETRDSGLIVPAGPTVLPG